MNIAEKNRARTRIFVNGMSLREISERYNIPLDTVTHRYSRGQTSLSELTRDDNLHNDSYRIEVACGNGKRFLQYAVDKKISLTEISKRTGIGRSTIYSFVYNGTDISALRLAKICGVVGCSMDYVMGLKEGAK